MTNPPYTRFDYSSPEGRRLERRRFVAAEGVLVQGACLFGGFSPPPNVTVAPCPGATPKRVTPEETQMSQVNQPCQS